MAPTANDPVKSIQEIATALLEPGESPWWERLPGAWAGKRINRWKAIVERVKQLGYWTNEGSLDTRSNELRDLNKDPRKFEAGNLHRFPMVQASGGVATYDNWLRLWVSFTLHPGTPTVAELKTLLDSVAPEESSIAEPVVAVPSATAPAIRGRYLMACALAVFLAGWGIMQFSGRKTVPGEKSSEEKVWVNVARPETPDVSSKGALLFVAEDQLYIAEPGRSAVVVARAVTGFPRWAPDGNRILYAQREQGGGATLRLLNVGAGSRILFSLAGNDRGANEHDSLWIGWHPDGDRICFADAAPSGQGFTLWETRVSNPLDRKPLTRLDRSASAPGDTQCAYSPDGRWLAVVRHSTFDSADLHRLNLRTGELMRWTREPTRIEGVTWLDSGSVIFSANFGCGLRQLWRLGLDGVPQPLASASAGDRISYPAVLRAPQDPEIFFQAHRFEADLWMAEIARADVSPRQLTKTQWLEEQPTISPDGAWLVYSSRESGTTQLWITDALAQRKPLAISECPPTYRDFARWGPNGALVFSSAGPPRLHDKRMVQDRFVYLQRVLSGGVPEMGRAERVTRDQVQGQELRQEGRGSWSPDGQFIYLRSNRGNGSQIWRVRAADGSMQPLTTNGGYEALEGPDGFVYYVAGRGPSELRRVPREGGPEETVLRAAAADWSDGVHEGWWAVTARSLFVILRRRDKPDIRFLQRFSYKGKPEGSPLDLAPFGGIRRGIAVNWEGTRLYWSKEADRFTELRRIRYLLQRR